MTSNSIDEVHEEIGMKNVPEKSDNDDGPTETTALKPKLETLDDALPFVGDFGKYQYYLLLGLLPYTFGYATLYFSQFFLTLTPTEHWCKIDELIQRNFSETERIQAAIPKSTEYPYYDTCQRKDLNFSEPWFDRRNINSPLWMTNHTVDCDSWEYNFTQIPYASVGAELDWVCKDARLISTAQAIFFCGSIVGGIGFGWVADHKGRVTALTALCIVSFLASCATVFSNSFLTFTVSRFFTGLAFDNILNIPLIIVFEYIPIKKRSLVVNIAFGLFFALSSSLLPWVAYFIGNWRLFGVVAATPMLVGMFTPFILPESARWYISHRMTEKVIEKLKRIATVNKKDPDRQFYELFYKNLNNSESRIESANFFDLFRTPRLAKNTVILILLWFLIVLAFDAHVYSLKLLKSSVFVSFSLACTTELPAGLILTIVLDRWGRRFCAFATMFLTTIFSLLELLLQTDAGKLSMSVSSRFVLNMAANVGLQYATELLPTPVRAQATGVIHIFGILGHSVAPYVVDTERIWPDLPMLIIVIVCTICSILILFLPETLGLEMPQTLEEAENFGRGQKMWSLPCLGSSDDIRQQKTDQKHQALPES